MALSVTTLSNYPLGSGSSTVDTAGTGLPAGTSAGAATFGALSITTPNYFPSTTVFIQAYGDGTQHNRLFIANNAAASLVSLPTLTQITQIFIVDAAGTTKPGPFRVFITPGTASADLSSPATVFLDPDAYLVIASTQYG